MHRWVLALFTAAAIVATVSCSGGSPGGAPGGGVIPGNPGVKGTTPISHVIIVIQENRSFDNLFATFPGADGTATGQGAPMPQQIADACASDGMPVITQSNPTIPLTKVSLIGAGFPNNFGEGDDLPHVYLNPNDSTQGFLAQYDGGLMDGFDLEKSGPDGEGSPICTYPYQYVDPTQIKPYWDIAQQYVLADHTFQTQGSGTFTAHQDLIAGATSVSYGSSQASVVDNPTWFPWGCDSLSSTVTSLLTADLKYLNDKGPNPCFDYATLRDLLDAKRVSWKYYAQKVQGPNGPQHGDTAGIWSAFDAIRAVRYSSEWGKNVTFSDTQIFKDITNGRLPAVSWITPDAQNSDHPQEHRKGKLVDDGPSWVASIVNAVGQSKYWKSSAIVILWDDWGGFYDHESPAFLRDSQGGLGFRVPMLIVSPYVQAHVESTQYEFGSILRFVEDNWKLGSLGTTDARSTPITNAFNFNQTPRPFQVIQSSRSRSYFLKQKPSNIAPDSE